MLAGQRFVQGGTGIPVARRTRTDEHSVSELSHTVKLVRTAVTGFRHEQSPVAGRPGLLAEAGCRLQVDLQRSQVTVVYADELSARVEGDVEFRLGMHLDEGVQAELTRQLQVSCRLFTEYGNDKQHGTCTELSGLAQLLRVDREVLTQQRDVDSCPHLAEVSGFPTEVPGFGQYTERRRSSRFLRPRGLSRVQFVDSAL